VKRPPTFVPWILKDYLHVRGARKRLKEALRQAGFECFVDGDRCFSVRFDPQAGPTPDNTSLVKLMLFLNEWGVAFSEDYKTWWSPADIMRELQKKGILKGSFRSSGWWVPPDGFVVKEVPPAEETEAAR